MDLAQVFERQVLRITACADYKFERAVRRERIAFTASGVTNSAKPGKETLAGAGRQQGGVFEVSWQGVVEREG